MYHLTFFSPVQLFCSALVLAMAEWFVVPIIEKVISTGFEYLKDEIRWQTGMKEELERLQENHPKIQAVVFASSQAQIRDQNPALNKWLWQLRDAIDEADDVLDEFEYMKHEKQLTKTKKQTNMHSTLTYMRKGLVKVGLRALKIDPPLKRLKDVVKKLGKVSTDVSNFLHLLETTKQEQHEQQLELHKIRETGSLPKNDMIGRDKDKEFVIQWLRDASSENETHITNNTLYGSNISLLSIVGLGGVGKTTLLQHVYEDEMTKEFDLKMWVCISNNFDVKRVIADMLESLKMKRPDLESLDALQRNLKSEVMSKKFLLVLDDIWEEEEERDKKKWENVFAPLACGSLGSKILVTTRMDSVALMITNVINKKKETLRLEGLEENDCLQLLNNYAFANVERPDDHHPKLKSIVREIVKKLSGSPLAAKVMGGILNSSLDERHWINILNKNIGSVEMDRNDIFHILKLSYMFLPKPIQNCFAFCSIFPQDHKFDKDDLVRRWIALGFIHPPYIRGGENMEDIGGKYFDVLVKKSFFDEFETENITFYVMHDLLHELAKSVSTQECFRFVGNEELLFKPPETVRHLSIETRSLDVLRKIAEFKKLRSLCLTCTQYNQDFVHVLAEIFNALTSLRLLYIDAEYLKMIPETIKYLIHLRYLMLYHGYLIQLLPRSLSKLYHLQFIIHETNLGLLSHDFLPRDMSNLSNLRHLELPWDIFPGMYGIGKLKSLQGLDGHYVKHEIGYEIGELEHMSELRQLRIKLLENVEDANEACSAMLCDKKYLTDLSLEWGNNRARGREPVFCYPSNCRRRIVDPDFDEKVLDNLQPPNDLKKLRINEYMGARSAIWMKKAHLISNLEYIQLDECLEWQTLPPFGQLPFLKSLYLHNMPKVKRLDATFHGKDKDCAFPSLSVLHIKKLESLEDWFDAAAAADDCLFPRLTELYLKDCPNLLELPSLPPKLKKLKMDNIRWKVLNWQQGNSNCCRTSKSIPLEIFGIIRCPNIMRLPLAYEIARLGALSKLTILDCRNLISLTGLQDAEATEKFQFILSELVISCPSLLQMMPLRSLTSLHKLEIEGNDELVSFPVEVEQWFLRVSSSLHQLHFVRLKSLRSLPSSQNLSSLKVLHVNSAPQLQLLPTIPASLEHLKLWHLESLQCLPSSLSSSSLKHLDLLNIPVQKLPDLPPSLCTLSLSKLENLDCLPSCLLNLCSLHELRISCVPQLRELPNLPPSLHWLRLEYLENLDCLPSCLPSLSSLQNLCIINVPQLRELPNLPPSMEELFFYDCHPKSKERCRRFVGSDWHKIAHIPSISMDEE